MVQETEHKFATKLREKKEQAAAGDVKAQKYLASSAAQVLQDYLDPHPITGAGGVPESRGGGLGAIRENDPVLSAGSQASQLARENLLYQPGGTGGQRRGNLTEADIKGINIPLVREGLSGEDYFRFNQMLYSPNIEEYEKARRWGSGKGLRDIVTMATPAKYLGIGANWLKDKALDAGQTILDIPSEVMGSEMVESIKEDWKGRKKGRGIAGFVEDILTTVGIGNTKKTNEFITKKTDNDTSDAAILEDLVNTPLGIEEIETNMTGIKEDKVKVIKLHELTDLKTKRNELYKKITQGNNEQGDVSEYEATIAKIQELEAGKLQDMKEGGIVSLYQGGPLDVVPPHMRTTAINEATTQGIPFATDPAPPGTVQLGGPQLDKTWSPTQGWRPGSDMPYPQQAMDSNADFWRSKGLQPQQGRMQMPQGGWGTSSIDPMYPMLPNRGILGSMTGFGEQMTGFGETLGGYGEQIGGFGEQLGGYQDALGGYGKDISSFKETMGGFGSQFENINNKLTSMEEGIASLSEKIGTTQGNTQPQGRSNFGYGFNAYNPWMFGGSNRFGYG